MKIYSCKLFQICLIYVFTFIHGIVSGNKREHLRLLIGFTGVLREILRSRASFNETTKNYISL